VDLHHAPHARFAMPAIKPNEVKNKSKRTQFLTREREEKAASRKRRREGEAAAAGGTRPKQAPRTVEGARTADSTLVAPNDAEVLAEEADDEFSRIYSGAEAPKVMVTTSMKPTAGVYPIIGALLDVVPRAFYYRRQKFTLAQISGWAAGKGFTHLVVLGEPRHRAFSLVVSRLPGGPTGCFKFSSPQLPEQIAGFGRRTEHAPELLLNNFSTRLGRRVGRLLGSLFPHKPDFEGRQVVTIHNQRDFIFFRHHRYVFEEEGGKARLQELGPRFTLKTRWLLAGAFNPREGEYEWIHKKGETVDTKKTFAL
jgi:ribosome production factor 1